MFFFFSYNAKDLFMYTHIFLVYLGMTFRGVFSSIISPFPLLKLLIGSKNAMYNAKNWKWFIYIHCVWNAREDKKPSQLIGKSEIVQINEWMNEKHVEAKVGRNFKAVCWHNWLDTCVTDVISLQPLYTLLLCS